ncbi:hypothetical protein P3T36_003376 [Kitasatospora sp. MAP12-15]|uniref:hypothetical protein n=1 Tax=unclassified Kitasatospora TaxID=2633591 RepID=UPI0024754FD6|nr:hypothetical protein [Kitasatospora sp. MAP12-44]MDH6111353.1 hypothetical protein [Kitasatospora sp. MAP12-44]
MEYAINQHQAVPPQLSPESYTRALAAYLPGPWHSRIVDISDDEERFHLSRRIVDFGEARQSFEQLDYDRACLLTSPARELLVIPCPAPHEGQYLIAPMRVLNLPFTRDIVLPSAVVGRNVAQAAAVVADELLPRYERALRSLADYVVGSFDCTNAQMAAASANDDEDDEPLDGCRWLTYPQDTALLRTAAAQVLAVIGLRLSSTSPLSHALTGVSEFVRDAMQLEWDLVPLIEGEAVTRLLQVAGTQLDGLFDPTLPSRIAEFDAKPVEEQSALVLAATAAQVGHLAAPPIPTC